MTDALIPVLSATVAALFGYFVGSRKSFWERKQAAYAENVAVLARMVYQSKSEDEGTLNRALVTLWLYANKDVAKKTDRLVGIVIDSSRGDATHALQETIAAMRRDIQLWPRQRLDPSEIQHLYLTRVGAPSSEEEP